MSGDYDISVPFGTLRLGKIAGYDLRKGVAKIQLSNTSEATGKTMDITVPIPNSFFSNDKMFMGALAAVNTPVVVARGEGTSWYFVSFLINNPQTLPALTPGTLLIQSAPTTKISLDVKNNINIGSSSSKVHIDTSKGLISSTFNNKFSFTEASREVNGIIKRDTKPLKKFPGSLKLTSDDYDSHLYTISLDPKASTSASFADRAKNPPFVEKRELVYEFAYSHNVQDDLTESQLYQNSVSKPDEYNMPNRRLSRSDALSLSLVAPNYLMETIKGTVVDIFGNILDINRFPIPVGTKGLTFKAEEGENIPSDVFNKIKAAERRSIAFHFELNARKDLSGKGGQTVLPDIDSKDDYARNRSRFFFDVDKEGMFKFNVPATSETGNVPLLARYENNSTVSSEDNNNPNKLIFTEDHLDVLHDSFALGTIEVSGEHGLTSPMDRISEENILHGTAHHFIASKFVTYMTPYASKWLDIQYNASIDLSSIPTYDNLVSPKIMTSGTKADAGGRSGSINLDGSLEMNIGANTVDRQSLWLDTAGSVIGMFGRDKNHVSGAFSMDGDLIIQIGGNGTNAEPEDDGPGQPNTDSRFIKENNAYRGGALDIRVMNDGFTVSIIRVDKDGVCIATPNTIKMHARDISLTAEGDLTLDGDNVVINGRFVSKLPNGSI